MGGEQPRHGPEREDRGGVHDRPARPVRVALLLEHDPQDRRGREDVAARVQPERPVPGVGGERVERTVTEGAAAPARDVEEPVDAAERQVGGGHRRGGLRFVGEVGDRVRGMAAGRLDRAGELDAALLRA